MRLTTWVLAFVLALGLGTAAVGFTLIRDDGDGSGDPAVAAADDVVEGVTGGSVDPAHKRVPGVLLDGLNEGLNDRIVELNLVGIVALDAFQQADGDRQLAGLLDGGDVVGELLDHPLNRAESGPAELNDESGQSGPSADRLRDLFGGDRILDDLLYDEGSLLSEVGDVALAGSEPIDLLLSDDASSSLDELLGSDDVLDERLGEDVLVAGEPVDDIPLVNLLGDDLFGGVHLNDLPENDLPLASGADDALGDDLHELGRLDDLIGDNLLAQDRLDDLLGEGVAELRLLNDLPGDDALGADRPVDDRAGDVPLVELLGDDLLDDPLGDELLALDSRVDALGGDRLDKLLSAGLLDMGGLGLLDGVGLGST